MENFYQNHRRYVKSRNHDQLRGNYLKADQLRDCDPIMVVGDLHKYQRKAFKTGDTLPDLWPAIPCGLTAKSMFNDSFVLLNADDEDQKI